MAIPRTFRALSLLAVLAGCSDILVTSSAPPISTEPGEALVSQSSTYVPLRAFKPRKHAIPVAVYSIPDVSGANKKGAGYAEFSKAVSQGADALVVAALKSVGQGTWFNVLERRFSENLFAERRIAQGQIVEQRQRSHVRRERARLRLQENNMNRELKVAYAQLQADYANPELAGQLPPREAAEARFNQYRQRVRQELRPETPFSTFDSAQPLPDLKVARYMITGAIVAYDHDVSSTGAGVRFLNVGTKKELRKDTITVNLRLVDVANGEITASETVSQTVVSVLRQGDFLNYVTVNKILEAEAGLATNEPRSVALDAALRLALSRLLQKQAQVGW